MTQDIGEILTDLLTCGIISVFLSSLIRKPSRRLLTIAGLVQRNYAGESIPTSAGVIFVTAASWAVLTTVFLCGITTTEMRTSCSCLLPVLGSSFAGLIDDVFGSHVSKGLIGHAKVLLREQRITTGVLKAVITWLLAAAFVALSRDVHGLFAIISDATLISLAANFMNLLDLQPGRSMKVFLIIFLLLLGLDCQSSAALVPVGLAGAVVAGLNDELSEQYMMGDAGANPLGTALGCWVALRLSPSTKAFVFLFLISVHIYSERHSISKTIDGNSVLRFIDRLGRSQQP